MPEFCRIIFKHNCFLKVIKKISRWKKLLKVSALKTTNIIWGDKKHRKSYIYIYTNNICFNVICL